MPGDYALARSGFGSPNVEGRAFTTTVTLSSGSATLTYTDIDGVDADPTVEPYVLAIGTNAGQALGVTSKGTSQAVVDDGSGSTTNDVELLVVFGDE